MLRKALVWMDCTGIEKLFIVMCSSYSMWKWLYQCKNGFITSWLCPWWGCYCSVSTAVWYGQILLCAVPQFKNMINGLLLSYQICWGQLQIMKPLCITVIWTQAYGHMDNHCRSAELKLLSDSSVCVPSESRQGNKLQRNYLRVTADGKL